MRELVYIEIPTPETAAVRGWLQTAWVPEKGEKILTPDGVRLRMPETASPVTSISDSSEEQLPSELSAFVWSVQRTTYLKVFRWGDRVPNEKQILHSLIAELRVQFPHNYPEPPEIGEQSIFAALAPYYPLTVKFFQKFPQGEYDLTRAYWWEKRWREGVRNPQQPQQVIFQQVSTKQQPATPTYDLIYVGGALGVIHAAVMARLGYKVLLIERLPFGRMNREWNISRAELQSFINLGLFTAVECESLIAREYKDGFNKFFDGNNPDRLRAPVLHTPTVLNVALDAEKLLRMCGDKLQAAGGEIWDETEFLNAVIADTHLTVKVKLSTQQEREATGRLLVDAMGTASPIAWQLNGGRAFDSVCPTVGAVISGGFAPEVWDPQYGDVLNSHGDISRGRQLIWELFPGAGDDIAIYLFHYHQVNATNPGSLLEMYEDFFTILPEYRRCDMDRLVWKKATFGYIPGHFSTSSRDRTVAFDRLIAIGDAASLQSPLVFTGFGSLVRNLERLTTLLDTALKHDLLKFHHLNQIRAYQSNVAVTWLFSKGMMVPTGRFLPPQRINSMLNTFFGLLTDEPQEVADTFIKDRVDWLTFNRLALKAARKNPSQVLWIWDLAGAKDLWRWLGNYLNFGLVALISALLGSWFPRVLHQVQPWLESRYPALWLKLLAYNYELTAGLGRSYHATGRVKRENLQSSSQIEVRS
ncbi:NAD(P)/FAD-dependent oxidoreductase [Chroococcidiopsis sp. TS-821]|uniref:NAD(P)/FAD-dependent oxidoreductase n=1 Tax=Chroococcidiopsis sp. TS-821 TaxID=1378066 RepID=UPI000CEDF651|nr:flavin-dependent dehydrogenase [Chroococcidiopsis sp. TS-821]PPS39204.1 flavin-dependent dehydrogenase [Chroococcidiopsis sp. TS-821]